MAGKKNAELFAGLDVSDEDEETATQAVAVPTTPVTGIVVGRLVGLPTAASALVALTRRGSSKPVRARSLATLRAADLGRNVALLFEGGDPERPVVIGLIETLPELADHGHDESGEGLSSEQPLELDAESIFLTGKTEIVLRCGKASITLTRAGKVLIRGTYLLNRSSGVNRIKGGSVQIN